MTSAEERGVLSVEEVETLILSALRRGPHPQNELEQILEWAHRARIDDAALVLVLNARADVSVERGEVCFWPRGS